jgi:hypothetical protein
VGQGLSPELLPLADESPADYLARLKALHVRAGALIDAIEQRRPALGPIPAPHADPDLERPVRASGDRRVTETAERRTGVQERRLGMPDLRVVRIDRRLGKRDRRTPAFDRREGLERRRDPSPVPWEGRLRLDRVTVMWILQVLAWVAVVAAVLLVGISK